MKSEEVKIRSFEKHDASAVETICFETGYFGKSAGAAFGDRKLFAMIFAMHYPENDPGLCLVATVANTVVGYCFGTHDTLGQKQHYDRHQIPLIKKHILTSALWKNPRSVLWVIKWSRRKSGPVPKNYPAHLHINILPDFRNRGIGTALISSFENEVKNRGVHGIHLLTSSANSAAIGIYKKMGYQEERVGPINLWNVGNVDSLRFTKIL